MEITDIYLVYSDIKDYEEFMSTEFNNKFYCHFIDDQTKSGKKEAYKLKSEWGAKYSPFAITYYKDVPIKAFYSEAGNVINDLIEFLK